MEKILVYLVGLMAISEAFFISNREFRRIFSFIPRNDESQHSLRYRNNNLRQHHHRYPENIRDQINNQEEYYNEDNYEERNDNYSRNRGYYRNDKFLKPSSYNNKHSHHAGCDHGRDEDHDYYYHHQPEQRRTQKNYKPKHEMVDADEDYPEQKPKYYRNDRNSKNKKAEDNRENDTQTIFLSPEKIDGNYKKDYVSGVLVTIPKTKPVEQEETQNNYNPLQFIQKFFQPPPEENTDGQVYENFKVY